jgi:hypothetical protein
MVSFLRTQHSVSEHPNVTTCCISQLNFSFYRNQPIRADFCRGQITSEAGLLPLRGFDQRHHLTRDWAACLADPRRQDRVGPGVCCRFKCRHEHSFHLKSLSCSARVIHLGGINGELYPPDALVAHARPDGRVNAGNFLDEVNQWLEIWLVHEFAGDYLK